VLWLLPQPLSSTQTRASSQADFQSDILLTCNTTRSVFLRPPCQVTTINQETAEEGREPLTTLGSFRYV
jgi:hypothetical protein